ncbi:MAG: Holliday junction branch migration protein RuvA [Candidatus Gallimonas sp.]
MIGYLKGKVKYLAPDCVLLDVNGVGYEVICSGAAFSRLSGVKAGEDGEVYTYLQVKEDGLALFGFADRREKELFLKLTSVQGVGAKLAIALLSSMRAEDVSEAIATADTKRLSAVKGLGKKTAERIILELHGKISADELLGGESTGAGARVAALPAEEDDDAVSALMNLGFTKQESARAVERAKGTGAKTVEQIIAAALRGM